MKPLEEKNWFTFTCYTILFKKIRTLYGKDVSLESNINTYEYKII